MRKVVVKTLMVIVAAKIIIHAINKISESFLGISKRSKINENKLN